MGIYSIPTPSPLSALPFACSWRLPTLEYIPFQYFSLPCCKIANSNTEVIQPDTSEGQTDSKEDEEELMGCKSSKVHQIGDFQFFWLLLRSSALYVIFLESFMVNYRNKTENSLVPITHEVNKQPLRRSVFRVSVVIFRSVSPTVLHLSPLFNQAKYVNGFSVICLKQPLLTERLQHAA